MSATPDREALHYALQHIEGTLSKIDHELGICEANLHSLTVQAQTEQQRIDFLLELRGQYEQLLKPYQ